MRLLHASIVIAFTGCGFEHGQAPVQVEADAAVIEPTPRTCRFPLPSLRLCLEFDDGVLYPAVNDGSPNRLDPTAAGLTQVMRAPDDPAAKAAAAKVAVTETAALDIPDAMTIEMWINPDAPQAGIMMWNDTQYALMLSPSGQVVCAMAGRQVFSYSQRAVAPNVWTHVACTYDGERVRTYVNGATDDSASTNTNIATGGTLGTQIVPSFTGGIDGVRVYAADLGRAEICTHAGRTTCERD